MTSSGGTIIESMGVYLPPAAVSTDEVLAGCVNHVGFPLQRMTGIRSRRVAGVTEYSIDLAEKAALDCLAVSRHPPSRVGMIICCNISRCDGPGLQFSFEPSTAMRLRRRLGLQRALAFDITNACAGMFTGIAVADDFLRLGDIECALVVSGEYITHLTDTAQKEIRGFLDPRLPCLTLGDAGAALMLERSPAPDVGFRAMEMYTLGRYAPLCVAKATDRGHGGAIMLTDAVALTAATQRNAIPHAEHLGRRHGWSLERCQHVIMHQTSKMTLDNAVHEINTFYGAPVCDSGKVVNNLAERGNTASTSYFVALMESILSGRIRSGDTILFSITGSGLTVGTALYTLDGLPERLRGDGAPPAELPAAPSPVPASARGERAPRVRIAGVGTSVPETGAPDSAALAQRAVESALADAARHPHEIALLLYAGMFRSELLYEPAMAALIAGRVDMNADVPPEGPTTLAFDVSGGAPGFLDACHLATQAIRAGSARTAVVAASEVECNAGVDGELPLGVSEVGSAVVLEPSPGEEGFGEFVHWYQAESPDAVAVHSAVHEGRTVVRIRRDPDLEARYLEHIAEVACDALRREGTSMDAVAIVFPPQLSSGFIARLAERLGVPADRMVDIARPDTDLYTSALPHALLHARAHGRVRPGDVGLLIGVGQGLRVSCATYYF